MKRYIFYFFILVFCISFLNAYSLNDDFIRACEKGDLSKAKELLSQGADIEARDGSDRQTALVFASNRGHFDVVKMLLDRNANINAQDDKGWTALSEASYRGHLDIVDLLLKKGATTILSTSWIDSSEYGNALFWCVESQKNDYNSKLSIVKLLLDNNTEPEGKNENKLDTIGIAKQRNYKEIVELFEKCKEERISKFDEYALLDAIQNQDLDNVKKCLETKVNPNSLLPNGESLLNYAVSVQNYGIVKVLLEYGANPNTQNILGTTAFMSAIKHGNQGIVNLLLSFGVNKNQRDNEGRTALFYAVENNDISMLSSLLGSGTNKNTTDIYGMTAFMYACTLGNMPAVKYLIANGCNISTSDIYDMTALHIAVQKNMIDLVQLLLTDDSIDIFAVDAYGNDVFYYAEKTNNVQIKNLLEAQLDW
ncbi:MAG: ankyrin repeat domain-containing protein [Spirochaetaceae bacterium]|nr:ankyrin repeat domain-containing protein [Spirochaetaceae bacterium]